MLPLGRGIGAALTSLVENNQSNMPTKIIYPSSHCVIASRFLTLLLLLQAVLLEGQMSLTLQAELASVLEKHQGQAVVPGIAAAVKIPGQEVWQKATGSSHEGSPLDPKHGMGIGSNNKTMTAVLIMKLVEAGRLALDDHLGSYLPSYEHVDGGITIGQLLRHQSGVAEYFTDEFFQRMLQDPTKRWTPEEILSTIGPADFDPGVESSYSNTNYILLGMIVERVSGQPYANYLRGEIFDALDLNCTFAEGLEPVTCPVAHPWVEGEDLWQMPRVAIGTAAWAAGCVVSNVKEMVTWYDQLFNGNVLTEESIREMTDFGQGNDEFGLGLLRLWDGPQTYWCHAGQTIGYSSFFLYDPDEKYAVTVMVNDALLEGELSDPKDIALDLASAVRAHRVTSMSLRRSPTGAVKVFPNPVNDKLTIEVAYGQIDQVTICDLAGRIFRRQRSVQSPQIVLGIGDLPPGAFLANVVTRDGHRTWQKIIRSSGK